MNEINKYLSEKKVNEVIDAFEKMLESRYTAKIPMLASAAISAAVAIYECVRGEWLFGILLFICLLPLVFALGAFGMGRALKRMISGINLIFRTTVNVSVAVYNDRKVQNEKTDDMRNIMLYSFRDVLLPVLTAVGGRAFVGRIILRFVGFALKKGARDLQIIIRKETASDNTDSDFAISTLETVDKIAYRAVSAVAVLSKTVGIFLALGGGLLTAILFTVRHFVSF